MEQSSHAANVWYFPLEPLKSRYTEQLSTKWMPNAFAMVLPGNVTFRPVVPSRRIEQSDIQTGVVLDATGRGVYSLLQCEQFLEKIRAGEVRDGDAVLLQDFWTPGFESIPYALHLHGIQVHLFSMLHAQTVDEYDFTYPMRYWMRHFELGMDRLHTGIFVASTVHKEQLRAAGFCAPIHVVSLPLDYHEVSGRMTRNQRKEKTVIYCSRLDAEKQPLFMLQVAERFLRENPDWGWQVTTSRDRLSSNQPGVADVLIKTARLQPRFQIKTGLTKDQYYNLLNKAAIQFNSSLQDYVSWTLLEACVAGCDLCYPDFRSFPECVPGDRRYQAFDADSALSVLQNCMTSPRKHHEIAWRAHRGRLLEAEIILDAVRGTPRQEVNIWESDNVPVH